MEDQYEDDEEYYIPKIIVPTFSDSLEDE